jgi:hypothetical protein
VLDMLSNQRLRSKGDVVAQFHSACFEREAKSQAK